MLQPVLYHSYEVVIWEVVAVHNLQSAFESLTTICAVLIAAYHQSDLAKIHP